MKVTTNNYIIQIEGKDILNLGEKGIRIKGDNKKKYKATLDYSLECLQLGVVAKSLYKDDEAKQNIFYNVKDKQYTDVVISVTFEYSVKEYAEKYIKNDKIYNYYVKFEEIDNINLEKIEFDKNGEYIVNGVLCAFRKLKLNADGKADKTDYCGNTVLNAKEVRDELYEKGFMFNKTKMVRFKRSSGSSRIGKCLMIAEPFEKDMLEWSMMGLVFGEAEEVDLAGTQAYISLTTSSIIDTIKLLPKNILLISDAESIFTDTVMATTMYNTGKLDKNGKEIMRLKTAKDSVLVKNVIWDGQSLLDSSVFNQERYKTDTKYIITEQHKYSAKNCVSGKAILKKFTYDYSKQGFLLLRARMTKTACFNTNIQDFFKDNNITKLSQLNYIATGATCIEDILMITTKSSIKYLKFNNNFMDYINELENTWGVVKTEHKTHYFNGSQVSTHYQLMNTLQMDKTQIEKFLNPSFEYLKLLKTNINVFRNHLKMNIGDTVTERDLNNTNDLMLSLLELNNDVEKSLQFDDFREDVIDSYIKNMRKGHIMVNGNYSVLFGNSMEMLKATIKDENHKMHWNGTSTILVGNEIYSKNFKHNIEVLGCRSPHCTMGNLALLRTVSVPAITKYFNLSPEIVCVNSINFNLLETLSSSDFDSDQLILTNNDCMLTSMKNNFDADGRNKFLVPTSCIDVAPSKRMNTWQELSKLDQETSINLIGEIINCSQILNSKLMEMLNNGIELESNEAQSIYSAICQLDVMSCLEIDKAKREIPVNNGYELNKIRAEFIDVELVNRDNYKVASNMIKSTYDEMIYFKLDRDNAVDCRINNVDYDDYKTEYKAQIVNYSEKLLNYKLTKVKPSFFKYVAKKEYKDQKCFYRPYNSTMDILEEVITEQTKTLRAERNSKNGLVELLQIVNTEDIKLRDADRQQIKVIISKLEAHKLECNAIWSNTEMESEEKHLKCKIKQNEIALYYKDNIKKETMYKIIHTLGHTEEYDHIARRLLTVLFKSNSKVFLEIFTENKIKLPKLVRLYRDVKETDEVIKIYDMNFVIKG